MKSLRMPLHNANLTAAVEREERDYEGKFAGLRAAIDEGDASGTAEGDVFARIRGSLDLQAKACCRELADNPTLGLSLYYVRS